MSKSLLEVCNDWQIERAMILQKNPDARLWLNECDSLIEQAVIAAMRIARSFDDNSNGPKLKETI